MKVVINTTYGGFRIPDKWLENWGESYYTQIKRDDPRLIHYVYDCPDHIYDDGEGTRLEICELPDNTTDYIINCYDGYETVYYVVDGKIHSAY